MKGYFKSAFACSLNGGVSGGSEPAFTTMKYRQNEGLVKHTIDYVFFKGSNIEVDSYL